MNKIKVLDIIEGALLEQAIERDDADIWFDSRVADAQRWLSIASGQQWHVYGGRCTDADMAQRFFESDDAPFAQEIAEEARQKEEQWRDGQRFSQWQQALYARAYQRKYSGSAEDCGMYHALNALYKAINATIFEESCARFLSALDKERGTRERGIANFDDDAEIARRCDPNDSTYRWLLQELRSSLSSGEYSYRGSENTQGEYGGTDVWSGGTYFFPPEVADDYFALHAWRKAFYRGGVVALESLLTELQGAE